MAQPTLSVMVTSPTQVLFRGQAQSVTCPGEQGTFEVLPLHRPLVSRLLQGAVVVDQRSFTIQRGVMRIANDIVTVVVELP